MSCRCRSDSCPSLAISYEISSSYVHVPNFARVFETFLHFLAVRPRNGALSGLLESLRVDQKDPKLGQRYQRVRGDPSPLLVTV